MTCSAEFYPRRVGDTAKAYSRSRLAENRKEERAGLRRRKRGASLSMWRFRRKPAGFTELSAWRMPSAPPFGNSGDKQFLAGKLNRNFGALFLCRRAAGCRRFSDDAVRCRACGACGIREVQNAGRRIVNSELFFYLCNRIVGFSRSDGPIAQSVRAADS